MGFVKKVGKAFGYGLSKEEQEKRRRKEIEAREHRLKKLELESKQAKYESEKRKYSEMHIPKYEGTPFTSFLADSYFDEPRPYIKPKNVKKRKKKRKASKRPSIVIYR
jgi:hypothetical protein